MSYIAILLGIKLTFVMAYLTFSSRNDRDMWVKVRNVKVEISVHVLKEKSCERRESKRMGCVRKE